MPGSLATINRTSDLSEHLIEDINTTKACWITTILAMSLLAIVTQPIGQIFFINSTESMPRGIYLKQSDEDFISGDIIVFNSNFLKAL